MKEKSHFSYDPKAIKAVFIDLDGTLVDSLPELYQVYTQFLQENERTGSYAEFRALNGPSLKEIVSILQTKWQLQGSLDVLTDRYRQILLESYKNKIGLFPGSADFLQWIKSQNLQAALVTSADKAIVDVLRRRYDIFHLFDHVTTGEMVSQSKPHPAIFQQTLQQMGLLPTQVLVIEDSSKGLAAAQAAHIYCFGFQDKQRQLVEKEGNLFGDWFALLAEFRQKLSGLT